MRDSGIALVDNCIVLDAKNCCYNTKVPLYIKEGSRVSIKILNVNPLSTKIKLSTSSDTINFGDFPTVFNLQFDAETKTDTPKTAMIPQTDASSTTEQAKSEVKRTNAEIKKAKEDLEACYSTLQNQVYRLQRFLNLESRIKEILATPIASRSDIQKRISNELKCFEPVCDTCCCWYQEKYIKFLDSIRNTIKCIYTNYDIISQGQIPVTVKVSGELEISKGSFKIKEQELSIEGGKSTPYDEAYKKAKEINDKILGDSLRKVMNDKVQSLTNMCNDFKSIDSFVVCRNLSVASGDVYKLNSIIITGPKGDTVWQMPEIPFTTYGGHRLNFSTGIGFSFFGLDNTFYKEKINADTFKINRNNARNWVLPSVTAFIHSYHKSIGKWQPSLTFGISTNPANIETTRFFAGGSLIQGKDKRFVITMGVTAGPTDVLKGKFEEDKLYPYADFSGLEDADLTEKKLRINVFFGLSYNLSSKR